MVSTPNTEVYAVIDLSRESYELSDTPNIIEDTVNHKIRLRYNLTAISGTGVLEERVFNLSAYDPSTFQYVEVNVSEGSSLKGHGTTSQDEADSSGDE
jgi:hypothetical protein